MADEPVKDSNSIWSREQDKAFENALVDYPDEDDENRWEKIAGDVPGKSVEEIKRHYEMLMEDLDRIESGLVPLPCYSSSLDDDSESHAGNDGGSGTSKKAQNTNESNHNHGGKASKSDQERRKGIAWTEDEHRLFLLGLEKYGKGDWRSISRNYVVTRTPTQVASHAQKYFIRLNSMNRDRRRTSIHDITSVNNGDVSSSHQIPITGSTNPSSGPTVGAPMKHRPHHPVPPGMGMYGAPMGHPVAAAPGHMPSAVGTPVMMPHSHHHHPPYVMPVAYPMAPPPAMHQ